MYSQLPSNADREAYELVKSNPPSAATHPNTFAWFVLIHRFQDVVRNTWAGAQVAAAKGAKPAAAAKKEEPKKEEPKKAAKADEDEMDLFGDDDEEEAAVSIFECFLE